MNQTDFDDAYANAAYIENADAYPPRWTQDAQAFRDEMQNAGRAELNVSYGPTERQAYDLFHPDTSALGTMIFVHGGYWLRFDRSFWSHFAQGAVARGWSVAMPSYDLCPDVSIADITRQISQAVETIAARNQGPLTLSGHSAGGHLVSRMLAPGMVQKDVLARICQVVPISPVADLRPLMQTAMNSDFDLDLAAAMAESPVLQPVPTTPVTVWVGEKERPVFLDQARWLAQAWDCPIVCAPSQHHFNVIDALADADSALTGLLSPVL